MSGAEPLAASTDQSVISAITLAELSAGPQITAATAIANGLPLYTCDPEDFEGIPALDLRPVPHPDR